MKERLEWGATASAIVTEKGIMYGTNEIAKVAKAAQKMAAPIKKGVRSDLLRTARIMPPQATTPMAGKISKTGRSVQRWITRRSRRNAYTKVMARTARTPANSQGRMRKPKARTSSSVL